MSSDDKRIQNYYDAALTLIKNAGKFVQEQHKKPKKVELKSCDVDLVTETDKEVENMIVSSLSKQFPESKFIGEESAEEGKPLQLTDDPTWIIDPVDGTMNFVHGYPNFCISLALWIKKKPVLAFIYNPILELMYTARAGKGAFLNGKKLSVSSVKDLDKGLLAYEFGTSREPDRVAVVLNNVKKLIPILHGIRSSGSAALNIAAVAMGAAECYFEFGIHIWDIAAGVLLVKEAGGVVSDPSGGELDPMSRRILCANNQEFANRIIPHLTQHFPPRD